MNPETPSPDSSNSKRRLFVALACYAGIAALAGLTLDGKARLVVWLFLAYLAFRTYLHSLRKP